MRCVSIRGFLEFIFLRMGDDVTMFPYTAQFLVLSGTCFASVYGLVEFQVFLRDWVDYGS